MNINDLEFVISITYDENLKLEELKKLGTVEYTSPILNVIYLKTNKYKEVLELDGVLTINDTVKGKLV